MLAIDGWPWWRMWPGSLEVHLLLDGLVAMVEHGNILIDTSRDVISQGDGTFTFQVFEGSGRGLAVRFR